MYFDIQLYEIIVRQFKYVDVYKPSLVLLVTT